MATAARQTIVSLLFLGGAFTIAALLYSNRPTSEIAQPEQRAVTVDAARAVFETISIPVRAQGTVAPLRHTRIHAEVGGRVVEVSPAFNVGGFVAEGEILLRIDPRDYQTELLRAQAAVESAESNLAQERGRAEVALREWQKLPGDTQRSEEAKALYLRKPQLEQAEAQLLAARADLGTARDNLERSEIRAPYDALIRAKRAELGQFVGAGTELAEVVSVDYAEVRLPLPQSRLEYLQLPGLDGQGAGQEIDLFTDVAGEISHWRATLHRTEGVYDERSRVLYAVARIEDPYGLHPPHHKPLRLGSFVTADISGREFEELVRLPRHLIRAGGYIWVIDGQQRLRNRKVGLLRAGGDEVYVNSGIEPGELISLTALDSSFAGASVRVVSETTTDQLRNKPATPATDGETAPGAIRVAEESAAMGAGAE